MKILKFGGSSLGNPERIRKVINIILSFIQRKETIHVVVSAFQKITDQLIDLAETASKGDMAYQELYKQLKEKHPGLQDPKYKIPTSINNSFLIDILHKYNQKVKHKKEHQLDIENLKLFRYEKKLPENKFEKVIVLPAITR